MTELKSIHEAIEKEQERAIMVIDHAQQEIWSLHHKVKEYDEELGMKIWEWTLQIEYAVNVLKNHRGIGDL